MIPIAKARSRATALGASLALTASLLGIASANAPSAAAATEGPAGDFCSGDAHISKTMTNGTSWDFCWGFDAGSGLTVKKIFFKGVHDTGYTQAFDSIAPVAMNVPYDSGTAEFEDMGSVGWDAVSHDTMAADECPSTTATILTGPAVGTDFHGNEINDPAKPVLCVDEVDTGLAGRSSFTTGAATEERPMGGYADVENRVTLQGTALVIFAHSTVGNYEYETRYTFHDNGSIDVGLGATGELSVHQWVDQMPKLEDNRYGWPVGTGNTDYTPSHYHNGVWKVDFGIGGNDDQVVEEFTSAPTGKRGAISALIETKRTKIVKEGYGYIDDANGWWVHSPTSLNADGHARGYDIVFGKTDPYPANPMTAADVTFANAKACEASPQFNAQPGCEGDSLADYVDGENLTDPVAWVSVGFHHIARDEDQSPMPVHWQGFTLYPRDFTAQSPWTPDSRLYRNGFIDTDELEIPGWQEVSPSTTKLSLSKTSVNPGTAVRATVSLTAPKFPNPQSQDGELIPVTFSGWVVIKDGDKVIDRHTLKSDENGAYTVTLPKLGAGKHVLTAEYQGNSQASMSTSPKVILKVVK